MLRTYELWDWSLVPGPEDPYLAPEVTNLSLQGFVSGHPRFKDGSHITTSRAIETRGRMVKTLSGSRYRLVGDPSPDYVFWCAENGVLVDADNPFS